jgi:hypothetical protein
MSDLKSKLPDLKELGCMSHKLFNGVKNAVNEIIHDYKEKRANQEVKVSVAESASPLKQAEPTVEIKVDEPAKSEHAAEQQPIEKGE